ncbi:hypothetical protein CK203_116445 [Vitis vinifera]|uniref:Uncharacterized protein n=1 Tax=Vitis vinifera TaxID=29760 RepID=A0A438DQM8_VITVI|nr:hypothetical protein CK203_116445 [Vitis vinifera]
MQEVSRVLRGRILLEYVMVMGWEITYVGLAHCGAHNRLNLSSRRSPVVPFSPLSSTYLTTRCRNYPNSEGSLDSHHE